MVARKTHGRDHVGGPDASGYQARRRSMAPFHTADVVFDMGTRDPRAWKLLTSMVIGSALRWPVLYRAALISLEFMSMVMVHPEVPRNSNGAGLGPRR